MDFTKLIQHKKYIEKMADETTELAKAHRVLIDLMEDIQSDLGFILKPQILTQKTKLSPLKKAISIDDMHLYGWSAVFPVSPEKDCFVQISILLDVIDNDKYYLCSHIFDKNKNILSHHQQFIHKSNYYAMLEDFVIPTLSMIDRYYDIL